MTLDKETRSLAFPMAILGTEIPRLHHKNEGNLEDAGYTFLYHSFYRLSSRIRHLKMFLRNFFGFWLKGGQCATFFGCPESGFIQRQPPVPTASTMLQKLDSNEVKIVHLRCTRGEGGATSALVPKIGPLGLSPKKG